MPGGKFHARTWTPRRILDRAWVVLRTEGLRALWFKILGETCYRRLLITQRETGDAVPPVDDCLRVEFQILTEADIPAYLKFRGADAEELRRRLRRGERCFTARSSGAIVNACWTAVERAWIEYLQCPIALSPNAVYVYEVFTDPQFRGSSISRHRSLWMEKLLTPKGCIRLTAAVWPENRAARRSGLKSGYQPVGMVRCLMFGNWRRHWLTWKTTDPPFRLAQTQSGGS